MAFRRRRRRSPRAPCAPSPPPTGTTTGSTPTSSSTRGPAGPGRPTRPTTGRCARPTARARPSAPPDPHQGTQSPTPARDLAAGWRPAGVEEQLGQLAGGGSVLGGLVVAPAAGEAGEAHRQPGFWLDLAPGG